jgi:hypothetical protein
MNTSPKTRLAMLRPLFLQAAGRSMSGPTNDAIAQRGSEAKTCGCPPMSSTKLSNRSSRNAKLRPISKGKLLSSDGARVANISSDRNDKSLPFAVCTNDPEVRPSGSAIETQTQTPSGLAKFVCNSLPVFHSITFNYLTSAHVDGHSLNPMVNQRSANAATTAIKTMPTVTETAAPYG